MREPYNSLRERYRFPREGETLPPSQLRKLSRFLCLAVSSAIGLGVVALVVFCVSRRFGHPYELYWMEGCVVDHARRIAAGLPLYAEPSADFIPLLYTPLSYHVTALLLDLGSFAAARLVSILSVAGAILTCTYLAARALPARWMSVWVTPLVMATYFAVDGQYDVARADNLLVLLVALSVLALTLRNARIAVAAFVPLATAAVFTKQSVLIFFVVLLASAVVVRRRVALPAALLWAAAVAAIFAWANWVTDGWFRIFTWDLPGHIGFSEATLWRSVREDFFGNLLLPTLGLLAGLVTLIMPSRSRDESAVQRDRDFRLLLAAAGGAAIYSAASRWSIGGARNVLILYAVLGSAFLPVSLAGIVERIGSKRRWLARRVTLLILAVAMLLPLESPASYIPTDAGRAAWARFHTMLAQYGRADQVWVVAHGAGAGGDESAPTRPHLSTMMNYLGAGSGRWGGPTGHQLPADLMRRIEGREFAAIVVLDWDRLTQALIAPYYRPDPLQEPFELPEYTGWHPGPERVWIPREPRASRQRAG